MSVQWPPDSPQSPISPRHLSQSHCPYVLTGNTFSGFLVIQGELYRIVDPRKWCLPELLLHNTLSSSGEVHQFTQETPPCHAMRRQEIWREYQIPLREEGSSLSESELNPIGPSSLISSTCYCEASPSLNIPSDSSERREKKYSRGV